MLPWMSKLVGNAMVVVMIERSGDREIYMLFCILGIVSVTCMSVGCYSHIEYNISQW
jgi:hypothetical protein